MDEPMQSSYRAGGGEGKGLIPLSAGGTKKHVRPGIRSRRRGRQKARPGTSTPAPSTAAAASGITSLDSLWVSSVTPTSKHGVAGTRDRHAGGQASSADASYGTLRRTLESRGKSSLFHMRNFNNWVKAVQIGELEPSIVSTNHDNRRRMQRRQLRVLDLACGKGGDLGKWSNHWRGLERYVGVDAAQQSLADAAIRARGMRKRLGGAECSFACADLGSADLLPGHPGKGAKNLPAWKLSGEHPEERDDPVFAEIPGGGIGRSDKFDVASIQFALHYTFSSKERALRLFRTVGQLLEVGGNFIFTTIDARVVVDHVMGLGLDLHSFVGVGDGNELHPPAVVELGGGECRLEFQPSIIRRLFHPGPDARSSDPLDPRHFGLEYKFTLVEGENHSDGYGRAVDLPEWLCPLPTLRALAAEAGMELEYAVNFHEFAARYGDRRRFRKAHDLLGKMNVTNWRGTISEEEWEISGLYLAVKFRKVRESRIVADDEGRRGLAAPGPACTATSSTSVGGANKGELIPIAMNRAKRAAGDFAWGSMDREEKKRRIDRELIKML